jgi:hypothetical protein
MIIMTPERLLLLLLLFTWMLVGVGLVAAVPSSSSTPVLQQIPVILYGA